MLARRAAARRKEAAAAARAKADKENSKSSTNDIARAERIAALANDVKALEISFLEVLLASSTLTADLTSY